MKRPCVVEAGRTTAASSQASPWSPVLLQSVDQPVSLLFALRERVPSAHVEAVHMVEEGEGGVLLEREERALEPVQLIVDARLQ